MEVVLINLLIAVIVLGIVVGLLRIAAGAGIITGWMNQMAMLVIGAVFLIYLLLYVLLPLMHSAPPV